MSDFKQDFGKVLKRAGDKAELVVRKCALDLLSTMVQTSPVDTGRFKSNWQTGVGGLNTDTESSDDSIGRFHTVIGGWKAGQSIWLTNSLPYARTLEYGGYGKPPGSANGPKTVNGYSTQAPAGMVRIAVADFQQLIRKAAEGIQ